MLFETERLYLRRLNFDDLDALCEIMEDEINMSPAYIRPFNREEVKAWIDRHLNRYETFGYGLWAVVLKSEDKVIGQCGFTLSEWKGREELSLGYLFNRKYRGMGYASEAAAGCCEYAFTHLRVNEVSATVRDSHIASQKVSVSIGMEKNDEGIMNFRGIDMNFYHYTLKK